MQLEIMKDKEWWTSHVDVQAKKPEGSWNKEVTGTEGNWRKGREASTERSKEYRKPRSLAYLTRFGTK